MGKYFNVTAECRQEEHYMVKLDSRLAEIRKMIDKGNYFVINRGRQYGKTTLLRALNRYLRPEYYVISMDFQKFDHSKFENGNIFSVSFADSFLRLLKFNKPVTNEELRQACEILKNHTRIRDHYFSLKELFEDISDICAAADRPLVLLVDEVDQATNNQVFLDFLAQLRAYYIDRDLCPTFQSVILAGVHDIKNLRKKIRTDEIHRVNGPWNIATDFNIDMSFSEDEIEGMLSEYENDYHTGMNINEIAKLLFDYTSGYPVLVSRLCKLMDEDVCTKVDFGSKCQAWTKRGLQEAVKIILQEKRICIKNFVI